MSAQQQSGHVPAAPADVAGASAGQTTGNAAIRLPLPVVNPAAADVVSILTAAQFGTYAAMFRDVSARFAAAHAKFVKSFEMELVSEQMGDPDDASTTT